MNEIHRKHNIDMLKPTFIENLKNQMIRGIKGGYIDGPSNGHPEFADNQEYAENSFENEVAPI